MGGVAVTWGRMDDKFHRNKKVRKLRRQKGGREALGVWAFWWSWCLDDPDLTGVVPISELDEADKKAALLLVAAELWEVVDVGYVYHDFHEYNPTKSQREAKKEADRERVSAKRKGISTDVARDSQASPSRVASESQASRSNVASESHPRAIPSHPIPSQPSESARTRMPEVPEPSGDAYPQTWPLRPGDPNFEPVQYLLAGFRTRYEKKRRMPWQGHQHQPNPDVICRWLTAAAVAHGAPFERLADFVLNEFFEVDPWPAQNAYPWRNFVTSIPRYVPDAKAAE